MYIVLPPNSLSRLSFIIMLYIIRMSRVVEKEVQELITKRMQEIFDTVRANSFQQSAALLQSPQH